MNLSRSFFYKVSGYEVGCLWCHFKLQLHVNLKSAFCQVHGNSSPIENDTMLQIKDVISARQ